MEKRELKVGDKVRIKSREELERLKKTNKSAIAITSEMLSLAGTVAEVKRATSWYYYLSVDGCRNMWLTQWVEPIEKKHCAVFIKGVPGRGKDVEEALLEAGGKILTGLPEYTFEDAKFLYFIEPKDCFIHGVECDSLTGRVVQSSWSEIILPEEKVQQKAEEKKQFVLVHDNRCMRRLVNSPEEARHFAEWIQKDKPGTTVFVYEVKLHEIITEFPF